MIRIDLLECQRYMFDLFQYFDAICRKYNIEYWLDGGSLLGSKRHGGFIPWDDDMDICLLYNDYQRVLDILEEETKLHPYYSLYYKVNNFDYWCDYLGDSRVLAHGLLSIRIDLLPVKSIPDTEDAKREDISLTEIANFFMKGKFKNRDRISSYHYEKFLGNLKNLTEKKALFFKDYFYYLSQHSDKNVNHVYTYSFHDMLVKKDRRYYKHEEIYPLSVGVFDSVDASMPHNSDTYLRVLYGDNYMTPPPSSAQKPYADSYLKSTESKENSDRNKANFLKRDLKHFEARAQKWRVLRIIKKFQSFMVFTLDCLKNLSFRYWWYNLVFVTKKGGRF